MHTPPPQKPKYTAKNPPSIKQQIINATKRELENLTLYCFAYRIDREEAGTIIVKADNFKDAWNLAKLEYALPRQAYDKPKAILTLSTEMKLKPMKAEIIKVLKELIQTSNYKEDSILEYLNRYSTPESQVNCYDFPAMDISYDIVGLTIIHPNKPGAPQKFIPEANIPKLFQEAYPDLDAKSLKLMESYLDFSYLGIIPPIYY